MRPIAEVLLADADPAARHALALLLRSKLGLTRIAEAADGAALTRALAETEPDLLLLDWSLPGRPDPAVLRTQSGGPECRHLVILSVDEAVAAEAAALGAVFIYKGSPAEQVLEQLRAVVSAGLLPGQGIDERSA
jgi:two-component system LytT family response regulator